MHLLAIEATHSIGAPIDKHISPDTCILTDAVTGAPVDHQDHSDDPKASAVATVNPTVMVSCATDSVERRVEQTEFKAETRPSICVRPGHLQEMIGEAAHHLAMTGNFFQYEGATVAIHIDAASGESGIQALQPMDMAYAMDGVMVWQKEDKRSKSWSKIDPPERICKMLTTITKHGQLPVLNGLTRQPFLRPDGSLCTNSGYDSATGLYGVFDANDFDVPEMPSRRQAEEALTLLQGLLNEFSFASESDQSAALAAMLTAAIRSSFAAALMFHVRAPQIASGKTYLCEIITAFASPQPGSPIGFPNSNDECSKLLVAELLCSPAVIEFDNLTSDIKPYKSLCTALTSGRMKGRILGVSDMAKVGTRTLFLSSGNNVGPVADMARRCVTIHLDPKCEVPATRTYKNPNLIAEVLRARGRYVSAALTIVRAWITAGRPTTECKPVNSFGEWTALCRQPLLWLNQPDPATSVFNGMAEDPENEITGQFLGSWFALFGDKAMLVRDAISHSGHLSQDAEEFKEVMYEVAGERGKINSRKAGHWMKRHEGRVVNGLRLTRCPKTRNVESWRVESV
ncbi:MAG TPA: hypothetical protein PLB25_16185 [Rhodoferax sp.]|mgnify:CR=1 FL=1|nr:hypothetical protein [Rhodoferax sp.]